ncbi:MAG: septum formation initiator family protein [Nitrospira sp.]|nr:septum formation initiator family protein [Nitrospira sp.]
MTQPGNLLRKQVVSEIKKRRLITLTVLLLALIYIAVSVVFGDMGLLRYFELNKKRANLERQIKETQRENEQLKGTIKSIKEDPYYKEKHAREEFGLAKPDEYIFQYDK